MCAGPSTGPTVGGTGGLADGSDAAPDPASLLPFWVEPFPIGDRPGAGYEAQDARAPDDLGGLDDLDAVATAARPAARAPRRRGHDPAMLIFTSGSTGIPKGVVWNHATFSPQLLVDPRHRGGCAG
ncbi:hypothetical protein BCD48_30030 [Pseudofrankia sp. BMG5.36]|nr:hypothetical protein BCD48_30030 [Pseudofrankia sp. BMG5.36]